jgi:hypothetical protein
MRLNFMPFYADPWYVVLSEEITGLFHERDLGYPGSFLRRQSSWRLVIGA